MTSGAAYLGRRARTGIARWVADLTGDSVYWDGEDIRDPNAPYVALRDLSLRETMQLDAVFVPALSLDLDFTPDLGSDETYTVDMGETPLDVRVLAADTAAELPACVAEAWALSGFELDGFTVEAVTDTRYRFSGPAESGGVLGLCPGWGWEIVAAVYAESAVEYVQTVFAWDVEATYWGPVRGRGVALRKLARLGSAQSSLVDIHRLRRYTGLLPGRMDPIQHRGRNASTSGVAAVADIATRVMRFAPSAVFAQNVETLEGADIDFRIRRDNEGAGI